MKPRMARKDFHRPTLPFLEGQPMRGAERKVVGGGKGGGGTKPRNNLTCVFASPPKAVLLMFFLFFPGGKVALPQFFIDMNCSLNS